MRMVGVMARQAWYRWYDLIWQSISWPGDPGKIDVPATIEFESLLSWKHSDGEHCRNGIGCENIGGDESGSALFSHGEWVRFLDRRIFQSTAVPFFRWFSCQKSHSYDYYAIFYLIPLLSFLALYDSIGVKVLSVEPRMVQAWGAESLLDCASCSWTRKNRPVSGAYSYKAKGR